MAKQPELPAPEAKAPTKRVADPELLAISGITKSMEELDEAARHRVMSYLNARYSPAAPTLQAANPLSLMQQRD